MKKGVYKEQGGERIFCRNCSEQKNIPSQKTPLMMTSIRLWRRAHCFDVGIIKLNLIVLGVSMPR